MRGRYRFWMLAVLASSILTATVTGMAAQSVTQRPKFDTFEVATIKPVDPGTQSSRYIMMQGTNRFVEKSYTLNLLISAAYDLNPRTISGGPSWVDSALFNIEAVTPGDIRPSHDEQMQMLRNLLTERFKLTFHREAKIFSTYELVLAKSGPKLKLSTAAKDDPATVGPAVVYSQKVSLPARNATMTNFVQLMQRAVLDRPVVDKTELSGRYDFNLDWAPDQTQFGGELPPAPADAPTPRLFTAIEEQLGLRLVATRGPVQALVVDKAEQPSAN